VSGGKEEKRKEGYRFIKQKGLNIIFNVHIKKESEKLLFR
jgi:hypothetical protein